MWLVVLLVAVWTDLQAVKDAELNRITLNVSDIYIMVTDTERYVIDRLLYPVPYTFRISR